jgi:hypothetical protein
MGTTTFSGPIKAGTIKETTGTTLGSDIKNTGQVVMAQSAVIDIIGANASTTCATVPANSQIVDVILNVTTAANDSVSATVSVGTATDADAFIATANVLATGTTRGTLDTEATDIGTTDANVVATYTAGNDDGTVGAATVTVMYLQNNNLS